MTPYAGHPDQYFGPTTYSQHGEDLMFCNLFRLLSIQNPSWLDIGAHHPTNISNTKLLYDRGLRGVNIEANPMLIGAFQEERPEDVNVCVGVGAFEGRQPFFMFDDTSGLNTFDASEAMAFSRINGKPVQKQLILEVKTLTQIVDRYCGGKYPALLSCDVEGLDFEIIRSANFSQSRPAVICTEMRKYDTRIAIHLAQAWGYVEYCRMGENVIFVHRDNWHAVY